MIKSYNKSFKLVGEVEKFFESTKKEIKEENQILVQIFTGIINKQVILDLQNSVRLYFPNSVLIGATTDGEIINGSTFERTIAITITTFENSNLYSGGFENRDNFYTGQRIAKKLAKEGSKVVIILTDGTSTNGEELLNGFASINRSVVIAGGMAGDNGFLKESFVFNNSEIFTKGAVAVSIVNKDLQVFNQYNFGWLPFGEKLKITRAEQNIVYSIDNIRPVKIYEKYLGSEIASKLPMVGIEFPLIKIGSQGVNVARAVLGKSDEGTLQFAGNLNNGDTVQIGVGDLDTILNQSKERLLKYINIPVDTTFIYSCMARRRFLNESIKIEIKPFNSISTNAGFFTNGEFFSSEGENGEKVYQLMNQTITVLSIAEEKYTNRVVRADILKEIEHFNHYVSHTTKAISHLTNIVLKDFEKIIKDKEILTSKLDSDFERVIAESNAKDDIIYTQYKLAQIGELMGMIAHQWRQPLASILSVTSSCKLKLDLDKFNLDDLNDRTAFIEHISESIFKIETSVDFLSKTMDNFRKFYRDDGEIEFITVIELIEHTLTLVNDPRLKFKFKCNGNIKLKIRSNQIIQVFLNIIKNASDVFKERDISNGEIIIECAEDNTNIYICFSDNGGGIADDVLPYIFEKSFTTKQNKGGTGLGLYMSKLIIENKCKGSIDVIKIDSGAKFKISLPIKND